MIDAEDRVTGADLGPALKAALSVALRVPSMPVPFWTIRVMLLIILLWPAADLVRMTVVTLASLMIVMRPFIPFFLGHVVRGLLRLWSTIIGRPFQHAGALHFGLLRSGRSRPSGTSSWASLRPTWTGTASMVEPRRGSCEATAPPPTAAAG